MTRTFDLKQNFLTVGYENLYTGINTLDETNLQADVVFSLNDEYIDEDTSTDAKFDIGGTDETVPTFVYDGYEIENKTKEPYHWEYDERISPPSMKDTAWPAKGKALVVTFKAPESADKVYQGVEIQVRYEIYEGIPVISKIINVTNTGNEKIYVHRMATEVLPIPLSVKDSLYFETDMNMGYNNHSRNNGKFEYRQWDDVDEDSGLLTCQYLMYSFNNGGRYEESYGPNYGLAKDESFTSYKLYELFHSSSYFEWQNMEIKKMYRVLFPQICDAPLIYHVIASDTERVKAAVDQAEEAGFNMVLMSFGSGANVEDISEANIAHYKDICDYAHEKGIMIGAYVMQYARYDNDASTDTGDRCMVSGNAETTLENTLKFIDATGMDCLEVDGPYPGGVCSKKNGAAENHHHDGAEDSIVKQWEYAIRDFYKELRERNVYINAPDWQYAAGASMGVMGYKEAGWAAPTKAQLIYSREMSYNAMFEKTPSMGWTMVPLDPYRGGADASFWPYNDKIEEYDFIVGVNMMYGVVGSYRGGNGLYQEGMSKNVMETWTDFYNKYRDILGADIVHIAPPLREDTQSTQTEAIDGFIHASADTEQKGLAAFFNQTGETVTQKIKIPLYFTGLTDCKTPPAPVEGSHYRQSLIETELKVQPPVPDIPEVDAVPTDKTAYVCIGDMDGQEYTIDSNGNIEIELTMEPDTYTWLTIYDPDDIPDSVGNSADIAVPENLAVKEIGSGSVTLTWDSVQMDGRDVKEYHVYRDGEYIGKTFENTYTDDTAQADQNYEYEVAAVHNTVAGGKARINVSTEEDVTAPMIESAKAVSENQIEIMFNESVDAATANNPENYAITDNVVTQAVLGTDLRTVTLTVQNGFQPFTELEAEAVNVKDLAGNALTEASRASFVFGYLREFKFEEEGGSTAVDSIYGENALINGTSQIRKAGISGNGLEFDGDSNYVSVGSVINNLDKYSISGWFMPEETDGNQTLVGQQRDNYDGWRWNLYLEDGVLKFLVNNGKGTHPGDSEGAEEIALQLESGEVKASAGEWNQFALVRDGDTFTLYLNGMVVDTGTQAGIDQSESPYLSMLGGYLNTAGGEPIAQFKGMMDEVVYYNTPISEEMVKELYDEASKPAEETDKTDLQKLYDQYKDLAQGNYTDDSWEGFQKALEDAKAVLDAEDASQKQVDDAKTALENAYMALEEKEEPTDPGDKPGSGNGQKPGAGTDGGKEETDGKAVATGDTTNPALLIALTALAGVTAVVSVKRRKR